MSRLQKVPPPALPYAVPAYTPTYIDQLLKVLRLYFSRVSDVLNVIIGVNGGQYVDCPNGLFFNTADQTIPLANTAYPVVYNQTYLNNAVSLSTTSRILITIGGIYNFQYTGQLESTNNSSKNVFLWIRRSGTDIGISTRAYSLSGNGTYAPIAYSFDIDMQVGQYLELMVSASDATVQLAAETASAPHPGIPSSVMTVNFVAPLPDILPIAP